MLLIVLVGCGPGDPRSAARRCEAIEADLRHDRLTQARTRAHKGAREWRGRPHSEIYVTFRLLESEALLAEGRAREALPILDELSAAPAAFAARREIDRGNALLKLGRYKESLTAIEAGSRGAKQISDAPLQIEGLLLHGLLYSRTGQVEEGLGLYRRALEEAARQNDSRHRAMALNQIGMYYLRQSHFDQAMPYFERARDFLDEAGSPRGSSAAYSNLAICYHELGDFDRAMQMQTQAIAVQEKLDPTPYLAASYGEAGRLYKSRGELQKALTYYMKALDLAKSLSAAANAAIWAVNLADTYVQLGDWRNAAALNDEARRLNGGEKNDLPLYVDVNAAAVAAGQGRNDEAARLYQQVIDSKDCEPPLKWGAYDELAKLRTGMGDRERGNAAFEQAIALIAATRKGLDTEDNRITFLSAPIEVYRDYVQALIDQGDTVKALQVADSSRARVMMEGGEASAADQAKLERAVGSAGVVAISYWLTPVRSYAWVVSGGGTHLVELGVTDSQVQQMAEAYRGEVEHGARDPLTNPGSAGLRLTRAVTEPFMKWISEGAHVVIVPDGPLHAVNLETLPLPGEPPHYWIQQATLSIAPSLAALQARSEGARGKRNALIIGDPIPEGRYARLGYASAEIDSVKQRFPVRDTTVLRGAQANLGEWRSVHPERYWAIHYSAHAEANQMTPLDSAIILSKRGDDYKLYARDIAGPLRAELVTVSACESAGRKAYLGEGPIGFAWAFLHAGAKHVIAGLWNVDDRSSARLMDRLYAGIAQGRSPEDALRDAKLEMLGSSGNQKKPYYWGALQVYRRGL